PAVSSTLSLHDALPILVGLYRTNAALEAAWKYFILGSVGIALALFGTILVYLAAEQHLGEGMAAMAWDHLVRRSAAFDPALLNLDRKSTRLNSSHRTIS